MNNSNELLKAGQVLCENLIEKAWASSAFKNDLITNPEGTFESVTGMPFPSTHKIVVEDQSDDSVIYLNIPAEPNLSEFELSDEQLELVAGGGTPIIGVAAICIGGTLGVGAVLFLGACAVGYYVNS